jgi:predicted RecA/RadA family phage recombinase
MKNAIGTGMQFPFTNGGGSTITSGSVVKASHTLGISVTDVPAGGTGTLLISGRYTAPKVSGAVFAAGEKLLWDASAGAFDDSAATPASGDVMGAAIAAAAGTSGQTTCEVILINGNTTLTA